MKKKTLLFLFLLKGLSLLGQGAFIPFNNDLTWQYENILSQKNTGTFHSEIKPYLRRDVQTDSTESIVKAGPSNKSWLSRKLFTEDLFYIKGNNYIFTINPAFNFSTGKDLANHNTLTYNTRGFQVEGNISNKLFVSSSYFESADRLPLHVIKFINAYSVAPGYGFARTLDNGGIDVNLADAGITYIPNQWLTFQFGHGKNFIGDGYRSLILSDNSFNYPFFKALISWKNIQYMYLLAQFQTPEIFARYDQAYPTKNLAIQYLSWNAYKKLTLGLFSGAMWSGESGNFSGTQVNYFNPVPFAAGLYTPYPTKLTAGLLGKFVPLQNLTFYSQLFFENTNAAISTGGFTHNPALQLGFKWLNIFNIQGLHLRLEFNKVAPYTYSANRSGDPLLSYTHYDQSITDPLGASFSEGIAIFHYYKNNIYFENKTILASKGTETIGTSGSYDILSGMYLNPLTQTEQCNLFYNEIKAGYVLNHRNNFVVEGGFVIRRLAYFSETLAENYLYFGLKMNMTNVYHDF